MEKRKSYFNHKGFSLIELIIVIAIMAILVAIMVPVLIKWIEKSNVSSDTQLADTVRGAFLCAVTDARVLADSKSTPYINKMEDTSLDPNGMSILELATAVDDPVIKDSVEEILGMQVNDVKSHLKSKHGPNAEFYVKLRGGNVIVTITETDITAKKNPTNQNNYIVVD
ncbi:MAG: type II secretion system protein [Lachnospiraceae bacterium]|nr:type II secretion system protein [Lachnospiraceae bacterium]